MDRKAARVADPDTLGLCGLNRLYNPMFVKPLLGEEQYSILLDFNYRKSTLSIVVALFDAYFSMRSLVAKMEE